MSSEEFNISGKIVQLKEKKELDSSYKVKSYKKKLELMQKENIPQKPIKQVLDHFFKENSYISDKTKESIDEVVYSEQDRIIIMVTNTGKDIIWKRNNLAKDYGWFFFVTRSLKSKKSRKSKSKPKDHQEISIKKEQATFNGHTITLTHKKNMRGLYKNKEYFRYFNQIKSKNIKQMPIMDVLKHFFSKNEFGIPKKEKEAIRKIIYYEKEKVIVVKSLIGDMMYEKLSRLVHKYGWHFYITGVKVGDSELSIAVDKIEKRFTQYILKNISVLDESGELPRITLYPVSLKPNYNCVIVSIGDFNLMLDCGIDEQDFEALTTFLETREELTLEACEKLSISPEIVSESHNQEVERDEKEPESTDLVEGQEEDQSEDLPAETEEEEEHDGSVSLVPKIDAIFVSHSHYDHISALKELVQMYPDVPILCSRITLDLYLLRDSDFLKQEDHDTIEEEEYLNVIKNVVYVEHGEKVEFKENECYLGFFHAGHMPGALMGLVKIKEFRFLYTGDYTLHDYTPFAGTGRFLEQISRPIDYLFIDSTCAYEEFEDIQTQLHSLILFLEQKAEYGDDSLIGADPSSLALTFMLRFWRYFRKRQLRDNYKKRPNIYVDGMVRKNIQVINHRYKYIYGPISKLIRDRANPFNSIKFRWFDYGDLDFLKKKNNIIITHPPDLSYGIIRNVISRLGRHPHNLVYLSGAIHEQPGLDLISDDLEERTKEREARREREREKDEQEDQVIDSELDKKEITNDEEKEEDLNESEDLEQKENNLEQDPSEIDKESDEEEIIEDEIEEKFESYVQLNDKGTPEIVFSEKWVVPFRAMFLNKFLPNLKIKLHGDKKQLFEMVKNLEPRKVFLFHQSYRKLKDVADELLQKFESVEDVSIPWEQRLIILN